MSASIARATVRAVSRRKILPTRAALTLISLQFVYAVKNAEHHFIPHNRQALPLSLLSTKMQIRHVTILTQMRLRETTPSAVNKVKQLLQNKSECIGLKVGVRTRGCNGLTYTLDYTKEKDKSDEEVLQDGVRVFIEKKAQLTLLGTEMDFVETKLSSEFVFNNPNIKGTCGCGESFSI